MIDELISEGQYLAALEQLTDLSDEDVRYKRLLCLNAIGNYRQGAKEGREAKKRANKTYYDVVSQLLISLKEIEEFDEAIDLLVEELSMPYIPQEYDMAFNTAYDEILLAKQEANYSVEHKNQIFNTEEIATLLDKDDVNTDLLYMALDQMQQLNIRSLYGSIRRFLSNIKKPDFAKTLIMEMLIEQQVDDEFEVNKQGVTYYFNPSVSPLVLAQLCYEGVGKELQRVLENENPALMNQCFDFFEYYLYSIYPKEIYEEEYAVLAAALHYYVASLTNIELDESDLEIDYNVDMQDVESVVLALQSIE